MTLEAGRQPKRCYFLGLGHTDGVTALMLIWWFVAIDWSKK